jgi:acyl-CoA synthetase (AMP-forming)/AMP-acid ligase II
MLPAGPSVEDHVDNIRKNPMTAFPGVALTVGPLYHTGPLCSLRGLFAGSGQVVLGRFEPEQTLAAIERWRVARSVMVPTHFQRLLALPVDVRARYDVSSLQIVGHTGAAWPIDVKRRMIDWWGPVLFEAYGATESGTTNVITSQEWLEHPGSVGRTIPPFELRVVDDDGNELGPGEVGRLFFRDTTGRGIVYHNNAEQTAAAHLEPGVFTLGEVGYVDADGFVFITDRVSDMIVSGGVNIYPAEGEAVLLEHPGVLDAACVGVPEPEYGEQLLALVVPADPDSPPTEDDLLVFCRERIAHFKSPRAVEYRDDLGRNAMGKRNKRALRAPYWPTERTIGG